MNAQEIDLLLPETVIDEIVEAAHKMMEAWNTLAISLTEAGILFKENFMKAFGYSVEEKKEEPPSGYSNK